MPAKNIFSPDRRRVWLFGSSDARPPLGLSIALGVSARARVPDLPNGLHGSSFPFRPTPAHQLRLRSMSGDDSRSRSPAERSPGRLCPTWRVARAPERGHLEGPQPLAGEGPQPLAGLRQVTGRAGDGGGGSDDTSLIDLSHDPIRMPPTQYPNPSHELFPNTSGLPKSILATHRFSQISTALGPELAQSTQNCLRNQKTDRNGLILEATKHKMC